VKVRKGKGGARLESAQLFKYTLVEYLFWLLRGRLRGEHLTRKRPWSGGKDVGPTLKGNNNFSFFCGGTSEATLKLECVTRETR